MTNCSIYLSKQQQSTALCIPVKDDFSRVPQEVLNQLGNLEYLKTIDLDIVTNPMGMDNVEIVKRNFETQGYHIQKFAIQFNELG